MELYEKGDVKVFFKEGNIVLVADTSALHSENTLKVDYLFGKIKEAIPGKVDDAILDMIASALKAL